MLPEDMDLTNHNLETISSLRLRDMTAEELVMADSAVEGRFHLSKGRWWREVKPFFYQPACFMTEAVPCQNAPKPWLALGGYYHIVPQGTPSNGSVVVNEIANPANYPMEALPKKVRYNLRNGLAELRIGPVTDLTSLLTDGYRIYLAWERRTHNIRVKRSRFEVFREWITKTYRHPHNLILGAYYETQLVAYVIGHAAEGVSYMTKSFTDPDFYHLSPSTTLTYTFVRVSGQTPTIRKACNGLRSTKDTLESYKLKLGFQHISYPAFIHLRHGLRSIVSWWMPEQYRRLTGQYQNPAPIASRLLG
jgi:Acetyltransferase (GNAT) domain